MELTNQSVNSDTNKTAAKVIKLVEPLLGHSYTLWTDNFHNSPVSMFPGIKRNRLCWHPM
jgi:hypothetical protein